MTAPKQWEVATAQKLCFLYLISKLMVTEAKHVQEVECVVLVDADPRSRVCGLSGCRSAHHQMLHKDEPENKTSHNDSSNKPDLTSRPAGGAAEEEEPGKRTHLTTTTMKLTVPTEFVVE